MKTAREILLERHRQVDVKLDDLRRTVVAELAAGTEKETRAPSVGERSGILTWAATAWRELIWRPRRAWAVMAGLWLGIGIANLAMKAGGGGTAPAELASARKAVRGFEEQRELLAELLPAGKRQPNPRSNPRPRSEGRATFKHC